MKKIMTVSDSRKQHEDADIPAILKERKERLKKEAIAKLLHDNPAIGVIMKNGKPAYYHSSNINRIVRNPETLLKKKA